MEEYLSAVEVAKEVGVHYRTIENWAAQGHLEREKGKYGLLSAFRYKIKQVQTELDEIKNNPDLELKQQKLIAEVETQKAIARIKNLEADLLDGKSVIADDVRVAWSGYVSSCRAKLLALPAKLALELSGLDDAEAIRARLTESIDESLKEMSES